MKIKARTALALKDHYLQYYRQHDNYKLEEISIKGNGFDYKGSIKFLFDRTTGTLIITGDYGYAIFSWFSNQESLKKICDYVKDNYSYFASKCLTSSQPLYIYDQKKAKDDIDEWLNEVDFDESELDALDLFLLRTRDELVDRLVNCIDEQHGFDFGNDAIDGEDLKKACEYIDEDWWESVGYWGKTLSEIVPVWAHALDLGFRWKKQQGRNKK